MKGATDGLGNDSVDYLDFDPIGCPPDLAPQPKLGYGPSGILGVVAVIILVLVLMGRL
jgi:hypothetical protein